MERLTLYSLRWVVNVFTAFVLLVLVAVVIVENAALEVTQGGTQVAYRYLSRLTTYMFS